MKIVLSACLLVLLAIAAPAALRADEDAHEFPLTVHERVLANGLKVIVVPRRGAPTTGLAIAYGVGSVNEPAGQTGMAHYLEHMMFKGTQKTGVKDLALDKRLRDELDRVVAETIRLQDGVQTPDTKAKVKALEEERERLFEEQKQNLEINHLFKIYGEAGSTFTNAMTNEDTTTYIVALPPDKLELFFWVESDRLRNIVFRQFHAEKDVVREERRMYENRPGALFEEEVQRAIFGSHPYAHPVLGYHEDLRVLTRAELRSFWSTWYSPDNATIFVGGDVDPEHVFTLAERYFGAIPRSTAKRARVPMLRMPRSGQIRLEGRGRGRDAVDLYFRAPAAAMEEALDLELIASWLEDSDGALFQDLVENQKSAVALSADYDGRKYAGVLEISANLAPGASHEAVEARIEKALARLRDEPLSEETMTRLRRRYRAHVLRALQSDMRLGFLVLGHEMRGSWRDIERDLVRVRTLPAEALQAAARAYLVPENGVVALYTHSENEVDAEAATATPMSPAEAPEPEPAEAAGEALPASWKDLVYEERPFELPSGPRSRRVLSNGIRAFVVPSEGDPVVRVAARVLGGDAEDPAGKEGLAGLAAAVLRDAGIPGMSHEALQDHLEEMVAGVSASSDLDALTVSVSTFPTDLPEGLRILRELLTAPELDPKAFERHRDAMIARVDGEETRLRSVTSHLYRELLWGDVPETRRPTHASLSSITLDDVRAYLAATTGPQRVLLCVSGDFDADRVTQTLEKALGSWQAEGVAAWTRPADRNDPADAAHGLHVRSMPVSQGSVRMGWLTVPRSSEDVPALSALSRVLARRVFNTVRSVHGLAYQASADFEPSWRNDSPFTIVFQSKCASVPFAVHLAREEVRRMIAEGPTADEMADVHKSLDAGFRGTLGRGADAAEAFADLEANGAPLDTYDTLRRDCARVDAQRVREVAAKYLDPDHGLVLCVGDLDAMKAGDGVHPMLLSDLGAMTLHEAPVPAAEAPTTPAAVAASVLEALRAGDVGALTARASQAFRERLEKNPDTTARLRMLPRVLERATVSEPQVEMEGEGAKVTVPVQATMRGNPVELVVEMRLVREDDAWKVDALQAGPRR